MRRILIGSMASAVILGVTSANLAAAERGSVVRVGHFEQLFLDDYVIEKTENITRRINQVQKHGQPLVKQDRPWEKGRLLVFGTVLYNRDEKTFKMWHYCDGHVAYATSKDGLRWEKPELDIVLMEGKKTNLVIKREGVRGKRGQIGYLYEMFNVLEDENDPDPARRYKMGFLGIQWDYSGEFRDPYHGGQRRGLGTAVSRDGIHWTLENEWASYEICDGLSAFIWDPLTERYILYGRTKLTPEKNDGRWSIHGWGRAVNRIESKDFRQWSKGELVMAADHKDPKGTEVYSMTVLPHEGIYVGLVQMFYGLPDQGNLEIQLAISRDGKNFTRVEPRDPFIPEGKIGDWDRFNISVGMPPVLVDDELWFYYSGRTDRHSPYQGKDTGSKTGAIGLAKIKRSRFISLEASFDGGTLLTKPLALEGSELSVNANAAFGSIEVTIVDEEGKQLPGWKSIISGEDAVAAAVRFDKHSLEELAGRAVRIQFRLVNAQLFGFRVK